MPAHAGYPPAAHPADHVFDWEHGRVLDCVQIVLISAGRGELETRAGGRVEIGPDVAFALLPGEWHRYRPDPATGWDESWVELRGPVTEQLGATAVLDRARVVREAVVVAGLDEALEAIHRRARNAGPGFDPEFSALGLAVLAAWARAGETRPAQSRLARAITEAERQLTARHAEAVNIAALARELGVAYSHFRREFKRRTGHSPWHYVLHLRLSRARRLLAASDATLADVAGRVGFSSAFHLSTLFKQTYGISPHHWRKQLRDPAGRPD